MKVRILFSLLISLLSCVSAFSDLSVDDLEKINTLLKESETRTREFVTQEIKGVTTKIEEMDKRLTNKIEALEKGSTDKIDEVNKRLDIAFMLIIALMALIGVVIGIPQIIVAIQSRKGRIRDQKIAEQQQQIEAIQAELEAVKQRQTVSS